LEETLLHHHDDEQQQQKQQLIPGAFEVGRWLAAHDIPTALITSSTTTSNANAMESMRVWRDTWITQVVGDEDGVDREEGQYSGEGSGEFYPMIVQDGVTPNIAKAWGVSVGCGLPEELLMVVGDADGVDADDKGGIPTALVRRRQQSSSSCDEPTKNNNIKITADNLIDLPLLIWNTYTIQSKLLTNHLLPEKLPPPKPLTSIDKAAIRGDILYLQSISTEELHNANWNVEENVNTPLIWAVEHGQIDVVRYLLQLHPVVYPNSPSAVTKMTNHRGFLGCTAVSRAARRNNIWILQLLLLSAYEGGGGADPDIPNYKIQYPMHIAAFHGNREAVKVLIDGGGGGDGDGDKHHDGRGGGGGGANVNVLDRKGRRPDGDTGDDGIKSMIVDARDA